MNARKKSDATDDPVKPQVIDLGPEDVKVEPDAAPEPEAEFKSEPEEQVFRKEPPSASITHSKRAGFALPLAALIVGTLGGGWFYRDVLASYFPSHEVTELGARVAATEQATKANAGKAVEFAQQLSALSADQQKITGTIASSGEIATQAKSAAENVASRLASAEATVAETQKQIGDIKASIAALGSQSATGTPVDDAALAGIRLRLDAMEKELEALKTAKPALSPAAELTQALSGLRNKIAGGAPFGEGLAALKKLAPDAPAIADLEAQASVGLPNAAGLSAELTEIANRLPARGPIQEEESGYGTWLLDGLSGVVTVKTADEPDWITVAKETAAIAGNGSLEAAVKRIDETEGEKPPQLIAWRDRANARVAMEASLARLSDAVMQAIAEKG